MLRWLGLVIFLAACGDNNTQADLSSMVDQSMMSGPDLCGIGPADSICGHPCDTGNSLGVGKYCTTFDDCSSNPRATICPVVFDPTTHAYACTFVCLGPTDTVCGENASCQCDGGRCG